MTKKKPKKKQIEKLFSESFDKERKYTAKIPFRTIVVNLTEQCNLRCLYCHRYKKNYNPLSSMSKKIISEVLVRAHEHAVKTKQKIVVQFHGGEPTLKLDIIKETLKNNKKKLNRLDLRIQTNATNITKDFIDLCKKYNIQVGVSIDGPPKLTSIVREFGDGSNIFPKVEKNIKLIRKSIPRTYISCLCVISSANVNKAKEVFDYLIKNQHIDDISFLPLYPDFSPCINETNSQIIPKDVKMVNFSRRIFDLWVQELKKDRKICIPNFQIWFWNFAALNRGALLPNTCCGVGETMIFVDTDGFYYPCSPLSYERSMSMGNIYSNTIAEASESKTGKIFQDRTTASVSECKDCVFQGICRGGCPANVFFQKKDFFKKDPFCDYWKGIISYILYSIAENPKLFSLIPDYTIRF